GGVAVVVAATHRAGQPHRHHGGRRRARAGARHPARRRGGPRRRSDARSPDAVPGDRDGLSTRPPLPLGTGEAAGLVTEVTGDKSERPKQTGPVTRPRSEDSWRLRRVCGVRIATWNVSSLRSRIDRVEAFLARHDVDVLALQETKA